jgi:NAD(P)-dependent dehydrogenase (short-subunit alcohol dehydrogenase family)
MFLPVQAEETTLRGRLGRAIAAARRELRSSPPVSWQLADPLAEDERFVGRRVLVTGAAGLIGSQLVQAFVTSGATVHAVDKNGAGLDELAAQVASAGLPGQATQLETHVADLGDPDEIRRLAENVDELDVLVNNVGFNDVITDVEDLTVESWRHILDVNLVGPAMLTGELVPKLSAKSDGAVVFVTSINGVAPSRWLHYGAAKAALGKLVVDLAHQLAEKGVRVNAVAPGAVRLTDDPPDQRAISGGSLAGGAVPVEAIVHAVQFLCESRVSPMTTGQHLIIDGGAGMYRSGVHNQPLEQW